MEQIMTLRKAIEDKHIFIGTEDIRYEPDYSEVKLTKNKTGCKEVQTFQTSKLSWRLIQLQRGQLALLDVSSKNQNLIMQGKKGTENFKEVLNNVSRLWSSSRLNLVAKSINKKDYEEMSEYDKNTLRQTWIGTREIIRVEEDFFQVVYYVDIEGNLKKIILASKMTGKRTVCQQIRSIIYLPDKILIDLSTKALYRDYNDFAKMKLSKMISKFEQNKKISTEDIVELKEVLKLM